MRTNITAVLTPMHASATTAAAMMPTYAAVFLRPFAGSVCACVDCTLGSLIENLLFDDCGFYRDFQNER